MELGQPTKSFFAVVADSVEGAVLNVVPTRTEVQKQLDNATAQITGVKDSHIRFLYDNEGGLQEIVIIDTKDITTARKVWRMNSGGFGHSSNGYNGPYTLAMTQDGEIVADVIKTGLLSDATGKSYWNLLTGAMNIFGTLVSESSTQSGNYRMRVADGSMVFSKQTSPTNWESIGQVFWGNYRYYDSGQTVDIENLLAIYGANGIRLYSNRGGIIISKDYGIMIDSSVDILIGSGGVYSEAYTGTITFITTEERSGLTIEYENNIYVDHGFIVNAEKRIIN